MLSGYSRSSSINLAYLYCWKWISFSSFNHSTCLRIGINLRNVSVYKIKRKQFILLYEVYSSIWTAIAKNQHEILSVLSAIPLLYHTPPTTCHTLNTKRGGEFYVKIWFRILRRQKWLRFTGGSLYLTHHCRLKLQWISLLLILITLFPFNFRHDFLLPASFPFLRPKAWLWAVFFGWYALSKKNHFEQTSSKWLLPNSTSDRAVYGTYQKFLQPFLW